LEYGRRINEDIRVLDAAIIRSQNEKSKLNDELEAGKRRIEDI